MKETIKVYWKDTLAQDAIAMKLYFTNDAYINWHNTNEHFSVDEYIRANCEYPGFWSGDIEKYIEYQNEVITVVHVYLKDKSASFHVTSFFQISQDGKIKAIDEYWGDDGQPPKWRLDKHIGTAIQ